MTITLSGRTYEILLEYPSGRPLVTTRTGPRMSRVAPAEVAKKMLAGVTLAVIEGGRK